MILHKRPTTWTFLLLALSVLLPANTSCQKEDRADYTGDIISLFDSTVYSNKAGGKDGEIVVQKPEKFRIGSLDIFSKRDRKVLSVYDYQHEREELLVIDSENQKIINHSKFSRYPSLSPDGELIAYLCSDGNSNRYVADWNICVIESGGENFRVIEGVKVHPGKPAWQRDNRHLLVGSKDLDIFSIDTVSGQVDKILENGFAPSTANNSDSFIYLSSAAIGINKQDLRYYINIDSDEYCQFRETEEGKEKLARLERLFFNNSLYMYDANSGESKKLTDILRVEDTVIWSPDDSCIAFNDESMLHHDIAIVELATRKIKKLRNINGRVVVWRKD